jgi:hypothetical protein
VFDHVIYFMLPKRVCVLFKINFRTFMLLFYVFVTSISYVLGTSKGLG